MPLLEQFSEIDADDSLKAFAISMFRYIVEDPELLLLLSKHTSLKNKHLDWEQIYQDLQDEDALSRFSENIKEISAKYNWSKIENTYRSWGDWGWITNQSIVKFGLWGSCPTSQVEADRLVLKNIEKGYLQKIIDETKEYAHNLKIFEEAIACFKNRYYTACASILFSLIDGELISSKANSVLSNRKTGAIAGLRVITNVSKDEHYGQPGLFHLELVNYNSVLDMLFEHANGFSKEPKHINRNYLHHGMSKRTVLRKDCIKLFLTYQRTLQYSNHYMDKR